METITRKEIIDRLEENKNLPIGNDYFFDTFASLCGIDYPGKRVEVNSIPAYSLCEDFWRFS